MSYHWHPFFFALERLKMPPNISMIEIWPYISMIDHKGWDTNFNGRSN